MLCGSTEGKEDHPVKGMKCINDSANLKEGHWWKWGSEESKNLYKNFTENIRKAAYPFNEISAKYNMDLPMPHECPRNESCLGGLDSECAEGYEGPLCAVCSPSYYKNRDNCNKCPSETRVILQLLAVVVVVFIVVAVVVWTSKRKREENDERPLVDLILSRLKIVVGFYQVTYGLLEAFNYIKWPSSLSAISRIATIVQLNVLQFAPIHCVFPILKMDAFDNMKAMMGVNMGVIVISFVVYMLWKIHISRRRNLDQEGKVKVLSQAKEVVYRIAFFMLFVTYLSTCSRIARTLPLACRKLCKDLKGQKCSKYLKADYNIKCQGPEYEKDVIVSYCFIVYVVALPAVALVMLWRINRSQTNDQTHMRELNVGLRFLYEQYNAQNWYWELVEVIRKLILTSGLILIGGESRSYIGLACVVSGIFATAFAHRHPISDKFENNLQLTSLLVTFVNLGIGAVSKIPSENIPNDVDQYVDKLVFNILVVGANVLVIGMLAGMIYTEILLYMQMQIIH